MSRRTVFQSKPFNDILRCFGDWRLHCGVLERQRGKEGLGALLPGEKAESRRHKENRRANNTTPTDKRKHTAALVRQIKPNRIKGGRVWV